MSGNCEILDEILEELLIFNSSSYSFVLELRNYIYLTSIACEIIFCEEDLLEVQKERASWK